MLNDLWYSARSFARTPGSTFALLMSVALGVGSNAAVNGFANGLVARNSSPAFDAVVCLFLRDAQRSAAAFSFDDYLLLKRHQELFDSIGLVRETRATLVHDEQSAVVSVASVTPDVAALFDLSIGAGPVLSHRLWQTEFKGKSVRGIAIRVDDVAEPVGGVAPEQLEGVFAGSAVDLWMALRDESLDTVDRTSRHYWVLARLRPGVSLAHARSTLNVGRDGSSEIAVARYTGMTPETADGMARVARLLGLASAAVLIIACANVTAFTLGRAAARTHETSVRVALGATRRRLARQLLSDSVCVSLLGGALGLLVALWTVDGLPALFFEGDAERLMFAPDVVRIVLTAVGCVVVTAACALMPLFETRDDRPAAVLQRESSGPSNRRQRLRAALVIAQMTCCFGLVISTAFLLHGFRWSVQTAIGRNLENSILAIVHTRPEIGTTYFEEIERVALSVGAVSESTWTSRLPGSRPVWQSFRIEPAVLPQRDVTMHVEAFTPESLPLVKLPPVSGRMFAGRDTPQSCRVAILNVEASEDLFAGHAAGRAITDVYGQRVEIIGVVTTNATKKSQLTVVPTLYYYANQLHTPSDAGRQSRFSVPVPQRLSTAVLDTQVVSPNYFSRMGIRTTAGTVFSATPGSACRVAVVNQQAADKYFGGAAVGAAVIDSAGRRTEIVGVVESAALQIFQRATEPAIYYPMSEDFTPRMTLILRTAGADAESLAILQRRLDGVPNAMSEPIVKTLDRHLRQTALAPFRIVTVLVSVFSVIALVLAVLGLYSALSDSARERRREIALRIALGAQAWRVVRHVLEEGGRLAAAGSALGLLLSLIALRLIGQIAPADAPSNVWIWLAAPVVLLVAVAAASVLPALRALAVDPLVITRD